MVLQDARDEHTAMKWMASSSLDLNPPIFKHPTRRKDPVSRLVMGDQEVQGPGLGSQPEDGLPPGGHKLGSVETPTN